LLSSRADVIVTTTIVVLTALIVVGVARLVWLVSEVLLVVLLAAILATGLAPIVERLHDHRWTRRGWRLSRGASIAVTYLAVLIGLGLIGGLLVTPVVAETREFIQRAPILYGQLQQLLIGLNQRYAWLPDLTAILQRLPHEAGRLSEYAGAATGVAFRVFGGIVSAIAVLILSVYMLTEGPTIKAGFLDLFPSAQRRRAEAVLDQVGRKFGGWLRGQLLLGVIVGVLVGIGTWLLGLPYPLLLGLAAGVTELIPMLGPVLGAIPAVFVALFGPWWKIVAVIVLFTVIQQAENHLLVPRVMKMSVGLSPLLTIVALLVGAKLMGILGALLAVPIAAALQVLVGEVVQTLRPEG
jgi:predicted PurR-regulated permease PerM